MGARVGLMSTPEHIPEASQLSETILKRATEGRFHQIFHAVFPDNFVSVDLIRPAVHYTLPKPFVVDSVIKTKDFGEVSVRMGGEIGRDISHSTHIVPFSAGPNLEYEDRYIAPIKSIRKKDSVSEVGLGMGDGVVFQLRRGVTGLVLHHNDSDLKMDKAKYEERIAEEMVSLVEGQRLAQDLSVGNILVETEDIFRRFSFVSFVDQSLLDNEQRVKLAKLEHQAIDLSRQLEQARRTVRQKHGPPPTASMRAVSNCRKVIYSTLEAIK
jgi:hypothetical protein